MHVLLAEVEYAFTNRTPKMRLNKAAFRWLKDQTASEEMDSTKIIIP